jgi:hypothetical protein
LEKISKLLGLQFLHNQVFLLLVFGLTAAPFLLISIFVNPLYDDFSYSNNVLRDGFLDSQINLYQHWAGRYFSNILLSLNPIIWGNFTLYKFVPVGIILLTFLSIFYLVESLLDKSLATSSKLLTAGFITTLFLNGMPDTLDGIYWIPGSLSYQFANALTLFFLALMLKALENPGRPKVFPIILSCFFIVAIVGSSETSMVFLLFIVGSITVINFYLKSNSRWLWLGLMVLTIICSYFVISSPGNEIRGSFFANRHRLFYSTGMALAQEIRFLATWITNPVLILATILAIPLIAKLLDKRELLKNHFYLHPLILTVLLLGLIFCGLFPPYWATGMLGQHRSVNVAYFFFVTGWFFLLTCWLAYFKQKDLNLKLELPGFVFLLGGPILLICLFATNNSREVVIDLIGGKAFKYNQEMKIRNGQWAECARDNQADCQINKIQNYPATISRENYFNPTSFGYEQNYWQLREQKVRENENNQ